MRNHNPDQEEIGTDAASQPMTLIRALFDLLADQIAERVLARMKTEQLADPAQGAQALIDVDAAADRLGLSVSTVYRLSRRQTLPSVKVGERLLFEPEALDAYIASNRRDRQSTLRAASAVRDRR